MVERKAILASMRQDNSLVLNHNDERFGSCKCKSRFHKFFCDNSMDVMTLRTGSSQKKVTSTQSSRTKRSRRRSSMNSKVSPMGDSLNSTPFSVSPPLVTPITPASSLDGGAGFLWEIAPTFSWRKWLSSVIYV